MRVRRFSCRSNSIAAGLEKYAPCEKVFGVEFKFSIYNSFEIVVRLLGYGATIKIMEQDNIVFEQYWMRIDKQIAIERERCVDLDKEITGNDESERV